LCAIEVLSKYAWVVTTQQKTGKEMVRSLQQIFKECRCPLCIQSDQGKEFTNRQLKQAFKSIHLFTTRDAKTKASIVERFQQTLKARKWCYFMKHKRRCYVNVLPDLVHGYNHISHRSIRKAPTQINATNVLKVWKTLYGKPGKPETSALKMGDRVRTSKAKRTFEKGFCLFVCFYSRLSNFSATRRLSPLPVTGLQI
jgi:hypothetical protein